MRRALQTCVYSTPCRPAPSHTSTLLIPKAAARRHRSDNTSREQPAFPGFTLDTLDAPLFSIVPQTRTQPAPPPPEELPKTDDEVRLAKYRVVFGSRLAGPVERRKAIDSASTNVAGVLVPPKPLEPDNCCMSGCVNCVWDLFRDELEEWAAKSAEARTKLEEQRRKNKMSGGAMPGNVAQSMDEDGGGSDTGFERLESFGQPGADLFEGIPVGIREFMKTEKKLKERHRKQQSSAG